MPRTRSTHPRSAPHGHGENGRSRYEVNLNTVAQIVSLIVIIVTAVLGVASIRTDFATQITALGGKVDTTNATVSGQVSALDRSLTEFKTDVKSQLGVLYGLVGQKADKVATPNNQALPHR